MRSIWVTFSKEGIHKYPAALEEAGWTYEDTEWLVYNGLELTVKNKEK